MHILLVHQAFAAIDEPGGTRHHEIARHLAAKGHEVTIIASAVSYLTGGDAVKPKWKTVEKDGAHITIIRTYTYHAIHKSFVHRLFSFFSFMFSSFVVGLGVRNVDLVWGTSPPIFQAVTAWLLARLKGARFILEIRDLWPAFAVAVGVVKNKTLIRMTEWLEKFLYQRADRLMINSPGFFEHIRARGGEDLTLIPNGADMTMFDPNDDGETFREAHGLTEDFVVMYAGAHGLSNDLGVLLQAAALLRDEAGIKIVFLGDGKDKDQLVAEAETLGLENVLFLPSVPKDEMSGALAGADACVAILKPIEMYKTVYPNKVFDYMAAGRPVLLAIDGVVREVVENSKGGVFVEPGKPEKLAEAILKFSDSKDRCVEMGKNGRAYLEAHFDRTVLADELEKFFVDTLSK
jgi:glycosyltransferase involved in cell wall biosynthesis